MPTSATAPARRDRSVSTTHDGLQKYAPGLNVGEVAPVGTAPAVRVGHDGQGMAYTVRIRHLSQPLQQAGHLPGLDVGLLAEPVRGDGIRGDASAGTVFTARRRAQSTP
ncbi:hypothetical protein ABZZ36_43745 [Actinacidiphila glaucinigra]|uniref:hypothetical protein n=1 Tax=Actinacidiphila glaucinigra TaxID=235986 RepID=UPI0033BE9407